VTKIRLRIRAVVTAAALLLLAQDVSAEFGDIVMNSFVKERDSTPVVFSHAKHRPLFRCNVCHGELGFLMKAGANRIEMTAIAKGRYCGACHNGKITWPPKDCKRCHLDEALPKSAPAAATIGKRVDWVELLHQGKIKPRANVEGTVEQYQFDRNIVMPAKRSSMRSVLFSHKIHTEWLSCANCHPAIFETKQGANRITMAEISRGESCGMCHMRVAFPVVDCTRCHSVDKKTK
jgi:c(7)-type cytochrome triheme protein